MKIILRHYSGIIAFAFILFQSTHVDAQRKVLVEQFTNSGCPSCAGITPVIASYINANLGTALMLSYHTPFPYNDSMYYENSFQSDQRVIFANVTGVPTSRVDGNYFSGNLAPTVSSTIMAASSVAPRYNISFTSCELNGNEISANVLFESLDMNNASEDISAMIVVAERKVLKSSYVCCPGANSENEYPWVVRRMLPDETGTPLVNKNIGGMDMVQVNWVANNVKDLEEVRVVAFAQNRTTKAVYQAELSVPLINTGVNSAKGKEVKLFSAVNPSVDNNIVLHFPLEDRKYSIELFDVLGNLLISDKVNNRDLMRIDVSHLSSGLYFVKVADQQNSQIEKIIISK